MTDETPQSPWIALMGIEAIEERLVKLPEAVLSNLRFEADESEAGSVEQAAFGSYGDLVEMMTGEREPVPMSRWGKDHWSTFAYIETCCVDHPVTDYDVENAGQLQAPRMRTDRFRHGSINTTGRTYGDTMAAESVERHPTRLNDDDLLEDHDDWDCLLDMAVEGLVEIVLLCRGWVRLTDYGHIVAHALRSHRAEGGNFHEFWFEPPATVPE